MVRPTPEQLAHALALLRDGASCAEAARTIGVATKTISRRWPEYRWTNTDALAWARTIKEHQP